jgi:hypothetical protein
MALSPLSSSVLCCAFRCFEDAVFARFYPCVADAISRGRKPEPEEFAHCRSPTRSVLKSEASRLLIFCKRQTMEQRLWHGVYAGRIGRNEGHRGVTLQGRRVSPPRAGMPRNGAQRVDRTRASPLNRHGQCLAASGGSDLSLPSRQPLPSSEATANPARRRQEGVGPSRGNVMV